MPMKLHLRSDDEIIEGHHYVSYQVINYLEGFRLAMTGDNITTLMSEHIEASFEVIERTFKELDLASLKQDVRNYYHKLPFNIKEVYRIADEVRPTINSFQYKFRLKDNLSKPEELDRLFDELFTLISVRDDDKPRFKASLSTLMTQCVRDILEKKTHRMRFALVLYGLQGCGKTTFNSTLCKVMTGEDNHLQKRNLYSGFDSEELLKPVFRVEDLNYKFRDVIDVMKTYITNITETSINVKYKPEQRVTIRTTALMDTNNDFINIIKTDGEQRRFCIFELLPPEKKVKKFEERLYQALDNLFKCHSTEYFYDLDEISEENLRLTATGEELMDFLWKTFYQSEPDGAVPFGNDIDWKSVKLTKKELVKEIKKLLTSFDPNDDFLPDHLFLKIQKRFFWKAYDSDSKTEKYTMKENYGKNGFYGNLEKAPREKQTQNFFQKPVKPVKPVTADPTLENLRKFNSIAELLQTIRDSYVSSVLIANNRILFYGRPEETIAEFEEVEPEEVEDTRKFFDVSTLTPTDIPVIYWNKTKMDHRNTKFPEMVPLRIAEDLKKVIEFDTIGGVFTGGVAKNENFQSANVLLIDVDSHNGEDLSNIANVNQLGVEYFRVESKSQNGYHFYFPLSHNITNEVFRDVYVSLLDSLASVGVIADPSGKNPSRKFFGTPYVNTVVHHKGSKLDVIEVLSRVYRLGVDEGQQDSHKLLDDVDSGKSPKNSLERQVGNLPPLPELRGKTGQKENTRKTNHSAGERGYHRALPDDVGENPNRVLTDQYFQGELNPGHVVKDLPKIINYLLTLKKHNKKFYSKTLQTYEEPDVVIRDIKEWVNYDPSHVQFINTLTENFS